VQELTAINWAVQTRHFLSYHYAIFAWQNDNKINLILFAEDVEPVIVFKTENRFSGFRLTSLVLQRLIFWVVTHLPHFQFINHLPWPQLQMWLMHVSWPWHVPLLNGTF